MPNSKYIARLVKLERREHEHIWQVVEEQGLGPDGYDQALRQIIREHQQANEEKVEVPEHKFIHPPFP